MHFIGLDIGTSTICGIVIDDKSKTSETISKANDSGINSDNNWEKAQNPERILEIVTEILGIILSRHKDIKGIGISGQMHGILYIDDTGKPLSNLITWQDGRGNQIYNQKISYAAYLTGESGYPLSSGFGLVTHFFNKMNNLVPAGAFKICTIMDYVAMRLAGINKPLTDTSNAASLGLFDTKGLHFDREALGKVKIDPQILPEVVTGNPVIGHFNGNIPVFPAIGDNQAGFLGSIRDPESSILINVGTSGQVSVFSEEYMKIDNLDTRPFPGGGYILVGASLCGGNSFNLLKGLFEKTVETFSDFTLDDDEFFKIANSIDLSLYNGRDNLLVETLFEGTRREPEKRGSITNISLDNLTPGDLITGFFKGVSSELFEFYKLLPENVRTKKCILVGSGNAIRRNRLLCQSLESLFQSRLMIPKHREEAAFGACLCAIAGCSDQDRIKDIGSLIELENYYSSNEIKAVVS